jgi:hypothetical protein
LSFVLAVSLSVLACDGSPSLGADASPEVRDSAGVRLVEYRDARFFDGLPSRAPSDQPRWRVDGVPGRDAPELYRLRAATMLPDGRVVVAHAGGRELLIVDTAGQVVRAIGRAGNGPGEFRSVASVFASDDGSVLAYDPVQRRTIFFDSLGAVLEQRSVAVPPSDAAAFRPDAVLGLSPSGDPLVATSRREEQTDPIGAVTVRRFWVGADDRWRIARPDARADDSVYTLPSGALTMVPFARQPLAAVCGSDLVLAESHALRVQRWSLDGQLRVQVDIAASRRPATDADLREGLSVGMPPGMPVPDEFVAQTRALRAEIEVPALERVLCDQAGDLWLLRRPDAGAPRRLLLPVTADGRIGSPLSVPTSWRVLAVAADRILAVLPGEDGTEVLGMWSVEGR